MNSNETTTKNPKGKVILTDGHKRGDKFKYVKLLLPYKRPEFSHEVRYTTTTDVNEATEFEDAEEWCRINLYRRRIPHVVIGENPSIEW
jgi:hypothetical protein